MDCSQHGRGDVVTCPWSSLSLDAGQRVDASMPGALRVRNTTATCTSNMNNDRIDTAISTCPFLRYVSHQRGVNYTRKLITTPVVSMVVDGSHDHDVHNDTKKSKKVVPLFPEDEGRAFDTVLQLFHPGAGQTRTRGQMGSVDGCLGMEEGSRESVQCNVGEERVIGGWIGECQRNNAVEAEEEGGTRERVGGGRRAGHVGSLPSGMASISLAGFQFMVCLVCTWRCLCGCHFVAVDALCCRGCFVSFVLPWMLCLLLRMFFRHGKDLCRLFISQHHER